MDRTLGGRHCPQIRSWLYGQVDLERHHLVRAHGHPAPRPALHDRARGATRPLRTAEEAETVGRGRKPLRNRGESVRTSEASASRWRSLVGVPVATVACRASPLTWTF